GWVWRRTARVPTHRVGRYLGLALAACFVASHSVHAWAPANYDVSGTALTRSLPMFYPLRSPVLVARLGLLDKDKRKIRDRDVTPLGQPPGGELKYPLAPVRCSPRTPSLNVLLVIVDAM